MILKLSKLLRSCRPGTFNTTGIIKSSILFAFFISIFFGCKNSGDKHHFSYNKSGYWWQLLAFNSDKSDYKANYIAWVNACFKTQQDSVFYDSEHDLRDRFFIKIDSLQQDNFLKHIVSSSFEGDSICALIKPVDFFKQQFNNRAPDFCRNDTVIKIYLKIKDVLNKQEFNRLATQISNNEISEIESFFGSVKAFESSRDELGFYWIERPGEKNKNAEIKAGDVVILNYEGSFLNGRTVDISPQNFQFIYGTPDQLIKGLNYVISKLKMGQNSKIILPSHLAFGENGSSNGSIPPFTPMVYKINIIEVKN